MALYDIPLTLLASIQVRAADPAAAAALVRRFVDGMTDSAGDGFLEGFNSVRAPGVGLVEGFTGCDVEGLAASIADAEMPTDGKRWVVEPQRDSLKMRPGAETYFVACDDAEAEQWAVIEIDGDGNSDLVEDYPSREAAADAVRALEVGDPVPAPEWPAPETLPLQLIADGCDLLDAVEYAEVSRDENRLTLILADGRVLRVTAEVVGG